jgi:hypothetical protein
MIPDAVCADRGIVAWRWSQKPAAADQLRQFSRFCIDVDDHVRQIVADVTGSDLPRIGSWTGSDGRRVARYELPSACRATPNSVREDIHLWLGLEGESAAVLAQIPADLPLLRELIQASDSLFSDEAAKLDWPDAVLDSGRAIQSALGQYLEFINQVYDELRPSTRAWEGRLRDVAACSVRRLTARWRRIATVDAPPMALVVKLARRLPPLLEAICGRPRRVLRRERVATPVGQIQEIDTACLRWISQQPGRTLVEKAGHKQQLQSVRRFEDANTLENRVVRDVLVRCITAGRRYLLDNQRFSSHERLLLVRRFVTQCRRLLQDSPIGGVHPLTVVPQPNYVLQYDPNYHRIWTAYQHLLRRERQEDSLWRWRERTWAEMCWIGVVTALQQVCQRSPASRGECYFQDEHMAGRFMDTRTIPGDWWFEGQARNAVVQLVPDFATSDYLGPNSQINSLCPDFLLGVRSPDPHTDSRRYIGFWTLTSLARPTDQAKRLGESLSEDLHRLDCQVPVSGCILVAHDDPAKQSVMRVNGAGGAVFIATLPQNLWTAQTSLEQLVLALLVCP